MGGWWGCHGLNLRELGEKYGNFLDFLKVILSAMVGLNALRLSSMKPPHFSISSS